MVDVDSWRRTAAVPVPARVRVLISARVPISACVPVPARIRVLTSTRVPVPARVAVLARVRVPVPATVARRLRLTTTRRITRTTRRLRSTTTRRITDFQATVGPAPLFVIDTNGDNEPDIVFSARYGAVPQFHETSFPSGNSAPLHIRNFRAVFINGIYAGCNGSGCSSVYTPGPASGTITLPNGNAPVDQVTGWLLPNSTLPASLLENGVLGSLGAFQVRLSR